MRERADLSVLVQPILEVQHQWVEALLKADTTALDAILVASYVDTDESGCRFDKPGILAALKSGDLKLESITLLETQVHRYANSAVLIGTSAQTGSFQGQPIAPKILFTATGFCEARDPEALRDREEEEQGVT